MAVEFIGGLNVDGNVGIGTETPLSALDVVSTTGIRLAHSSSPSGYFIEIKSNYSSTFPFNIGVNNYGKPIGVQKNLGSSSAVTYVGGFYGLALTAGNNGDPISSDVKVFIEPSGNVGIGTTGPAVELDVVGDGQFQGVTPRIVLKETGTSNDFSIKVQTDGRLSFLNDNLASEVVTFLQSGKAGIGTTSPTYLLDVESISTGTITLAQFKTNESVYNGVLVAANASSGWIGNGVMGSDEGIKFEDTTRSVQIYANGAERMRIDPSGNVGIGITPTTYKFDVSGNGRLSSTVTATNFILSSDKRFKENIYDISPKEIAVKWKSFNIKDSDEGYRVGVIAQELEIKHPEFVQTDEEGFKSVKYIDLLISKISELENRIKQLER